MTYKVVFDVNQIGFRLWWILVIELLFVGALVWGRSIIKNRSQNRSHPSRAGLIFRAGLVFSYPVIALALTGALLSFASSLGRYSDLATALREGRCTVTEGVVSAFHPMPFTGHDLEWFVVNGVRFEYSDYRETAGFNQTASYGGPIRKGLAVRIHHRGNDIAKLEVAQ